MPRQHLQREFAATLATLLCFVACFSGAVAAFHDLTVVSHNPAADSSVDSDRTDGVMKATISRFPGVPVSSNFPEQRFPAETTDNEDFSEAKLRLPSIHSPADLLCLDNPYDLSSSSSPVGAPQPVLESFLLSLRSTLLLI